MKKIVMFLLLLALFRLDGMGQELSNFKVYYDKKVNLKNLYKSDNEWYNRPENKFFVDSFLMETNGVESNYTKLESTEALSSWFASHMTYCNVYTDIAHKTMTTQRELSDATFVLKDSMRDYHWKMTFETRSIAGYECHKAIGMYRDTIELVAFFSPQLHASLGPENINGLPGTILGLIIPKLHTTWLAKKIISTELLPKSQFVKTFKGKSLARSEYEQIIKDSYKEFDNRNLIYLRTCF